MRKHTLEAGLEVCGFLSPAEGYCNAEKGVVVFQALLAMKTEATRFRRAAHSYTFIELAFKMGSNAPDKGVFFSAKLGQKVQTARFPYVLPRTRAAYAVQNFTELRDPDEVQRIGFPAVKFSQKISDVFRGIATLAFS